MKILSNISKGYSSLRSLFRGPKPLFLIPLTLIALSSCVAEDLPDCIDNNSGNGLEEIEDYVLRLKINLPSLGGGTKTRAEVDYDELDETYEDYIDPEKLHILFFLKTNPTNNAILDHGNDPGTYRLYRAFSPGDPEFSMIPVVNPSSSRFDKEWYVSIAIPKMDDGEDFAEILRDHDFKVAVVANAHTGGQYAWNKYTLPTENNPDPIFYFGRVSDESDESDDRVTIEDKDNEGNTIRYIKLGGDINLLNHQTSVEVDQQLKGNTSLYGFLYSDYSDVANGKALGHYAEWLSLRNKALFDSEEGAYNYIRGFWNPDPSEDRPRDITRDYYDLWSCWNFGGSFRNNANPYPAFPDEWEDRNGDYLREQIEAALEDETHQVGAFTTQDWDPHYPLTYVPQTQDEEATLVIRDASGLSVDLDNYNPYTASGAYSYGIKLTQNRNGAGMTEQNTYNRFRTKDVGVFKFTAPASGKLVIKGRSAGAGDAIVYAQLSNTEKYQQLTFGQEIAEEKAAIKITSSTTDSNQDLYVYVGADSPEAAEIYSIEYVQDEYLFETNRVGIAPSEDQPIPMYGCQDYTALRGLWFPGTSFDLYNYNLISPDITDAKPSTSYFHPLPLLRSVAKVEILIPKNLQPNHVFMRSVNHFARWEPSDVETPTDRIWTDDHADFTTDHDQYCEFFHLMEQPSFYPYESESEYKQKLAYFYGNWGDTNGLGGVAPVVHGNGSCEKSGKPGLPDFTYPHIMNPVINRSEFVEFLHVAPDPNYPNSERYVLYVGEKFVDDPDDLTNLDKASPKVTHIEFRLKNDPYYNLDDDNCYRVYFTDEGYNPDVPMPDLSDEDHSWEKAYEQREGNLEKHWPILRNHYYRFVVEDITDHKVKVALSVLPWRKNNDISVSW